MATFPLATAPQTIIPQRPYLVDGLLITISGMGFTLASTPLSNFMGLLTPLPLTFISILTFVYGVVLLMKAGRGQIRQGMARVGILANDLSVITGIILLALNPVPLSEGGRWIVLIFSSIAAVMGIWQWVAVYSQTRR